MNINPNMVAINIQKPMRSGGVKLDGYNMIACVTTVGIIEEPKKGCFYGTQGLLGGG